MLQQYVWKYQIQNSFYIEYSSFALYLKFPLILIFI